MVCTEGMRPVMAPCAISSRSILATCSYGGTAESGSITRVSIPGHGAGWQAQRQWRGTGAGTFTRARVPYSELMDSAQRELSDQIDLATQRLLDRARIITEPDLRAPSLLPGWPRARVLAHLALGADAMRDLLVGA